MADRLPGTTPVPPGDDMRPPNPVRTGWRAALIDGACGVAAWAVVVAPPVETPVPLAVGLTGLMAALLRLYGDEWQPTWPARLAVAVAVATAGTALALPVVAPHTMPSAGVLAADGAAMFLLGLSWRIADGVRHRRTRRNGDDAPATFIDRADELSAMSSSALHVWHYRHLLRNLVGKQLALKYRGSMFGFAWTLVVPLMMGGVYVLAFTYVLRVETPRFALYLLVGLFAWNYSAGALSASVDAVSGSGAMLKSVAFPRVVLPLSIVLFHLVQYVLTLAVLLPVLLFVYAVPLGWQFLLLPVFLAAQTLFTIGLALGLSTATVTFHDVRHLVDVALGIGFWTTPIIYEMAMVPEGARFAVLLSPFTAYIRAYQDIVYYGVVPEPGLWITAGTYAVAAFVSGLSVFLATEAQFPELV
ncbi:MAG: ABC transporter permease [Vicinamibacterales bacterium]